MVYTGLLPAHKWNIPGIFRNIRNLQKLQKRNSHREGITFKMQQCCISEDLFASATQSRASSQGSNDPTIAPTVKDTDQKAADSRPSIPVQSNTLEPHTNFLDVVPDSDPVCYQRNRLSPQHISELTNFNGMTCLQKYTYRSTRTAYITTVIHEVFEPRARELSNTVETFGMSDTANVAITRIDFTMLMTRTVFAMFEFLYGPVPADLVFNEEVLDNLVRQVLFRLFPTEYEGAFVVMSDDFNYNVSDDTFQSTAFPHYTDSRIFDFSLANSMVICKYTLDCMNSMTNTALYSPSMQYHETVTFMAGFDEGASYRSTEVARLNSDINDLKAQLAEHQMQNEQMMQMLTAITNMGRANAV